MARLFVDENFPAPTTILLRNFGHDVLTIQDWGFAGVGRSDETVLAKATADRRAVLTLNRWHFVRLHQISSDHAGIIVCSQDADTSGMAGRIDDAIRSVLELKGQLIRVNRPPRGYIERQRNQA
ncbi:MAG: DUF5615 family PIN-like protein [Candidatus Hydrogenedentes bacterium]|nr:DUF5615 family PIN-like protein [Candidatus Hydrogenedentota bacterium]